MGRLQELKLEGLAVGDTLLGENTLMNGTETRQLMRVTAISESYVMLKLLKYEADYGSGFIDRTHLMEQSEDAYSLNDRKWTIFEKSVTVTAEHVDEYVRLLKQEISILQDRLTRAINDAEEKERDLSALKARVTKHFTENILGEEIDGNQT